MIHYKTNSKMGKTEQTKKKRKKERKRSKQPKERSKKIVGSISITFVSNVLKKTKKNM